MQEGGGDEDSVGHNERCAGGIAAGGATAGGTTTANGDGGGGGSGGSGRDGGAHSEAMAATTTVLAALRMATPYYEVAASINDGAWALVSSPLLTRLQAFMLLFFFFLNKASFNPKAWKLGGVKHEFTRPPLHPSPGRRADCAHASDAA
jgi:hypothetical protein